VKLRAQLGQHRSQPSGVEEVLHVEIARGLEIHEHGCLIRNDIEPVEGDRHPRASRDGREMNDGVGGAADGEKHSAGAFSNAWAVRMRSGVSREAPSLTAASPVASAARSRSAWTAGMAAVPGSVMPSVSARQAMVLAVPITAQVPAVVASRLSMPSISSWISVPRGSAPRSGGSPCTRRGARPPIARHHGAGHELYGGHARGGRPHELGGHRLVAAAHQHHRVHGLGPHHLLDVHGHEVAIEHARRLEEDLAERDGGELDGQAARRRDAALDRLDQLGEMAVTVVEAAAGVRDAHHRLGEARRRVTHRPREGASEIEGEIPSRRSWSSRAPGPGPCRSPSDEARGASSAPRPKRKKRPAATRRTQPMGTKRRSLTAAKTASPSAASMPQRRARRHEHRRGVAGAQRHRGQLRLVTHLGEERR
jgi:hypothetical protein